MPLSNSFRQQCQNGLTLVELLVAVAVSLIVVLAAIAALLISRQGFTQVDATSQLRDNAKFAESMIQRLALQAGFRDAIFAATPRPANTQGLNTEVPNVFGFNNRARSASHQSNQANSAARTAKSVGYGSDILVLRFQNAASGAFGTSSDQGMIDCSGVAVNGAMEDRYDRYSSVFHIAESNGEPTLMCTRWPQSGDFGKSDTQPLVSGVENFQVLYGVDGIKAGDNTLGPADSVVDNYLRADQITVTGGDAETSEKLTLQRWQRVRSIRIGMILRAAPGTAIGNTDYIMYPFGTGAAANMFASQNDPGTQHIPPNDGRLRKAVTFSVHLRNPQGDE